jgi:hypothetical protein
LNGYLGSWWLFILGTISYYKDLLDCISHSDMDIESQNYPTEVPYLLFVLYPHQSF